VHERPKPKPDSTSGLRSVPWVVISARALPGYRLHVRFIDGTEGEVDLSALIQAPTAGVFARLRDPAQFAQAGVTEGVVTWPGELDIAPDAMYDEIRAHGGWTIEPFRPDSSTR
jgi:uncharacterized protein DUF2442